MSSLFGSGNSTPAAQPLPNGGLPLDGSFTPAGSKWPIGNFDPSQRGRNPDILAARSGAAPTIAGGSLGGGKASPAPGAGGEATYGSRNL